MNSRLYKKTFLKSGYFPARRGTRSLDTSCRAFTFLCLPLLVAIRGVSCQDNNSNINKDSPLERTYNGDLIQFLFFNSSDLPAALGSSQSFPSTQISAYSSLRLHNPSVIHPRFILSSGQFNTQQSHRSQLHQNKETSYDKHRPNNRYPNNKHSADSESHVSSLHPVSQTGKTVPKIAPVGKYQRQRSLTFSDSDFNLPAVHTGSTPYTEVTDEVLLRSYRSRSPCFMSKLHWVRDEENCSVFFVCARHRVAAILTCPFNEVWSNRVTNCVPVWSRWDDCNSHHQASTNTHSVATHGRNSDRVQRPATEHLVTTSSDDMEVVSPKFNRESQYDKKFHRRLSERQRNSGKGASSLDRNTSDRSGGHLVTSIQRFPESKPKLKANPSDGTGHVTHRSTSKKGKHANTISKTPGLSTIKQSGIIFDKDRGKFYDTLTQNWPTQSSRAIIRKTTLPLTSAPETENSVSKKRFKFSKSGQILHRPNENVDNDVRVRGTNNFKFGYNGGMKKSTETEHRHRIVQNPEEIEQKTASSNDVEDGNLDPTDLGWWVDVVSLEEAETTAADTARLVTTPAPTTATSTTPRPQIENSTLPPYVPGLCQSTSLS